ncbi:MAG: tetratricopeptide repeat protein [Verrucomicrobiales bacterium]|nr:tetratricopeptide repeat protein [Verrucomicrobiales bacterium]
MTPHRLPSSKTGLTTIAKLELSLSITFGMFSLSHGQAAPVPERLDILQAFQQGHHTLAAQKLELSLNDNEHSLNPQQSQELTLLLLEALVRSQHHQQALALIAKHPELQQSQVGQFWTALALISNRQYAQAHKKLTPLVADKKFSHQASASIALAKALAAQNQLSQAQQLLSPLLQSPSASIAERARLLAADLYLHKGQTSSAEKILLATATTTTPKPPSSNQEALILLQARVSMQKGNFDTAIAHLEKIQNTEDPESQELHQQSTLLLAEALQAKRQPTEAVDQYLHLIKAHPDSAFLPKVFLKLSHFKASEFPELSQQLKLWSTSDDLHPERQIQARYYLAQQSVEKLSQFIEQHPNHPLSLSAKIDLAGLLIENKKINQAQKLLLKLPSSKLSAEQQIETTFLNAVASFEKGAYAKAKQTFAQQNDTDLAAYNIALAALYAKDGKTFLQYQAVLSNSQGSKLLAELHLEHGLFLASHSVTDAFAALSLFLKEHPEHARAADAHLALAELYLNEVPSKPVSAREHLEVAIDHPLTQAQQESLDYIAVWIEASDGNHSVLIEQALRYLDHWPHSQRAPEIRLKLGDAYYQEKDYFQSVSTLEQLVENHPQSPLIEPALFLAGRAASLSSQSSERKRAIELWAKLASDTSRPLSLYARHEQALFKLRLDEFDDAITAFDSILDHEPPPPTELKLAVLADRGQAMFNAATSQNNDHDLLLKAIQSFDAILKQKNVSATWSNQAAVRKGKCLERLNRLDDALATYHRVMQSDRLSKGSDPDAPVAQVEWFFRAGLAAIRLHRSKQEWREAIRIADRLATSGSPRAIEAAKLADRIRLKHFIWDQPER